MDRRPLRVLHLSTNDFTGGAARAAYRLHHGLLSRGLDSQMLVQNKERDEPQIHRAIQFAPRKWVELLDRAPMSLYPRRKRGVFTTGWVSSSSLQRAVKKINPDLIHTHWITGGFLRPESFRGLKIPMVWSLHDMWPLTGGCHYDGGCGGFKTTCGRCPILASQSVQDLSSWTLRRKHKSFGKLDVSIAADSDWIGQYSHQSSLFKNRRLGVIANGLDLKIFTPWVQSKARSQLNLPLDKKLLLFGAVNATSDSRKGFHLLKPALEQLRTRPKATTEVELVIFGAQPSAAEFVSGFKTHFIPSCNQEELLPAVYSSADAIVIPSVEDNLPNIATEGLACGVPVVAFAVGGLPEIIDHGQNGYLARPYEVADLATGLDSTLFMDSSHRQAYAAAAKSKVARAFDLSNISARYEAFYREILDDRTRSLASARRMI